MASFLDYQCRVLSSESCRVSIVPALSDNYMYMITDLSTGEAAVVDPVKPAKLLEVAEKQGCNISSVLTVSIFLLDFIMIAPRVSDTN